MAERLKARHEEFLARQEQAKAARAQAAVPAEDVTRFEADLNRLCRDSRNALPDGDVARAQQLHQDAADLLRRSKYFLPSYTIKYTMKLLADVERDISSWRLRTQPRPKFAFSKEKLSGPSPGALTEPASAPVPEDADDDVLDSILLRDQDSDLTISNLNLATVCHERGERTVNSISINNVRNSTISVCFSIRALRVDGVHNSTVMIGPTAGSVHIENCSNSTFVIASRQARIHGCHDVRLYMHVISDPIIEDCSGILVAPYNFVYRSLSQDWDTSGLSVTNKFDQVKDFKWHHSGHSPNWAVLPEADRRARFEPVQPVEDDY
ncbi:C-CAP/cofactor C-like domain-containing protein [Plasmodiophora brassicae]